MVAPVIFASMKSFSYLGIDGQTLSVDFKFHGSGPISYLLITMSPELTQRLSTQTGVR